MGSMRDAEDGALNGSFHTDNALRGDVTLRRCH